MSGHDGSTPAHAPLIAVDSLCKAFPGTPEVIALRPSTFQISAGEFIAVTGPSGSGKTTLLSLLGLLDVPTSGRYAFEGIDVLALTDDERAALRAHRIGFVFQAFCLLGARSVLDNVSMGRLYQGGSRRERMQRASELIDLVGLTHRRDALGAHLSGGEQQRASIARALMCGPSVVLCDEPTGNLDTANSDAVLSVLEALNDTGTTILVITHDPHVAARSRRVLGVSDGIVNESPTMGVD